jgi:predicted N-acetyltransferase YhbS
VAEQQAAENLELRELGPEDRVKGLSLGGKEYLNLAIFLQKDARRHHNENASKTYVFVNGKQVVGYISVSCGLIQLGQPPAGLEGYVYKEYPAVRIGKLAVDTAYRGRKPGLGKQLVALVVALVTTKVMPHVGCRFIMVDSHQSAVPFYEKQGFRLLDTEENKARRTPMMFLDVGKLA